MNTIKITVDNNTPSDDGYGMNYDVLVESGDLTIEGEITLFRDDVNGGRMSPCGAPLDGWCSPSIVEWVSGLDAPARRHVLGVLGMGQGSTVVEL